MSLEWTHPINNQHEYYNLLESLQHCCFVACRSWDLCSEFDNEWRDNIIYARVRDVKLEQKSPKLYKVVHVMTADEHSGSVRGNFPTGRLVSRCHLTWNSECDIKHKWSKPSLAWQALNFTPTLTSASKSRTSSLVSSVPFLEPTAHTSLVGLDRILHTTPPEPPESRATRSLMNSPEDRKYDEESRLIIGNCWLKFWHLTCPHVPQLDCPVVAAGDHKLVIEL